MKLALSNTGIVEFTHLSITAGITTTLMGNFAPDNNDTEQRIKVLQDILGADCHGQLIPNHEINTVKFITGCTDESAVGDAVIYGNERIGYFVLVHCSWITLSKGILLSVAKELEKFDFWNFGSSPSAFIYPGICRNCYEVDEQVTDKLLFGNLYSHPYFYPINKDHWLCDLSGFIRYFLIKHILRAEDIYTLPICSAHSRFSDTTSLIDFSQYLLYSHRRQELERNAIFVKLPKDDKLIIAPTGDCPYVIFYALPK